MKIKLLSLLASVAIVGLASSASAKDLKPLSNTQLDKVTAGATAIVLGAGAAVGTIVSAVGVNLQTAVAGPNAAALGIVTSIGSSFSPGPTAAAVSVIQAQLTSP
jgi:hypothetical protein